MEKIEYTISVNGEKAVNVAMAFQRGACYRGVYDHGKRIAQLEMVINDDEYYNGIIKKWVDVSYIKYEDIPKVIKQLEKLGFKGCPALVIEEIENGCNLIQKELCCFII